MAWNIKGSYIETCSCDFFCPCNFSLANGADYDYCRVTLVFNVTEGMSTRMSAVSPWPRSQTPRRS